jgi:hypothetical protein
MHPHRTAPIVILLATAWLASACNSPNRPSAVPLAAPIPPALEFVVISGLVFEPSGDPGAEPMPVSGADVKIVTEPSGLLLTATTDDSGWFEMSQAKGSVTITVSKEGYETQLKSIALSEDTRVDLEMKRVE